MLRMRSHCALYVDAGYLLSAAATRVSGTSLRSAIHVDYPALVGALATQAESVSQLPVLRSYWYDSARDGVPDAQQARIGEMEGVKLRLGRFGMDGQQKGVDLRIGLDLVNHARRRTAEVFFLVSGDDDLSEAVEEAQAHGVQVVVLAVPTHAERPHGVSRHLVRAADSVVLVSGSSIDEAAIKVEVPAATPLTLGGELRLQAAPSTTGEQSVSTSDTNAVVPDDAPSRSGAPTPNDLVPRPRPTPKAPPRSVMAYSSTSRGSGGFEYPAQARAEEVDEALIRQVAERVLAAFTATASTDGISELLRAKPSIPADIDRALLVDLSDALGIYDVPEPVRYRVRQFFWDVTDENLT